MRFAPFIIVLFLFSSCSKNKEADPQLPANCDDTYRITYLSDVRRIVNVNCNLQECHAAEGEASVKFESYAILARFARNGILDFRLTLPVTDSMHMPVGVNMDSCDLYKIRNWIYSGFPEN